MKKLLILCVVLSFLFSSCDNPVAITKNNPATLRDIIFSIEPRINGSLTVWMRNDDIGSYCTIDNQLISKITAIFNNRNNEPEVLLTYTSLNQGDAEQNQCSYETGNSKGSDHTTYRIIGVTAVKGE